MSRLLEYFWIAVFSALSPLSLLTRRGREWFQLQRKFRVTLPLSPVTWIHVASLGELEMGMCLVRGLLDFGESPQSVLITYTSVSAHAKAQRYASELGIVAAPLPFVGGNKLWGYLRNAKIREFLLLRTDLYPHVKRLLIWRKIPSHIVGYFSERRPSRAFLRPFQSVSCLLPQTVRTLSVQFPHSTWVWERDLKWESARQRAYEKKPLPRCLVLGSIWPADWKRVGPALAAKRHCWESIIIVPHDPHPQFVADLEKSCRNLFQGWEIAIGVPSHDDVDPQKIYIVDKVGGLMRLYSFASAAYVGGGFHHRIHNVYEALAYELPVVVGPRTQSTPEVSQWAVEGRIKICRSESDLRLAFEHFLPSFPQMPAPTDPASETTPSHQIIRRIRLSSPIQSESRP